MRNCLICKRKKGLDEFYSRTISNKRYPLSYCKDCWRENQVEEYKKPGVHKKRISYAYTYAIKNKSNPVFRFKQYSRHKVLEAIKAGKLIKGVCRDCGEIKVEAHHPDYNKPLDVIWLCRKHHVLEEAK